MGRSWGKASLRRTRTSGTGPLAIGVNSSCDLSSSGASNEVHLCGTARVAIRITGTATHATEVMTIDGTVRLANIGSGTTSDQVCANAGLLTAGTSVCSLSSIR
jgi:hypothetical protein